jgi:hypothetical protein
VQKVAGQLFLPHPVEPLSTIGAAGPIANMIDVASKTIKSLHNLHNRWRDAEFTLLNLIERFWF